MCEECDRLRTALALSEQNRKDIEWVNQVNADLRGQEEAKIQLLYRHAFPYETYMPVPISNGEGKVVATHSPYDFGKLLQRIDEWATQR